MITNRQVLRHRCGEMSENEERDPHAVAYSNRCGRGGGREDGLIDHYVVESICDVQFARFPLRLWD
jgi:hypothetical protein